MKRDLELIRELLLALEVDSSRSTNPQISGYTDAQIAYHAYLLFDGGYIDAADATGAGDEAPNYIASHLTWKGHDYLNAVRDPSIWAKVKAKAGPHLQSVSLEMIKALGTTAINQTLGSG